MPKVSRLSPELANQIAAGEVVERPASVVKEFVENAIDAGARRISIHTEFGGKKLIRVDDDGDGMSAEDACLSLERHATSKIARAEDLTAIRTLGFRGEALPSIASVCHLTLKTRARNAETGTEIRVNGGAVASVKEAGIPEGTSIEAADLFYNVPARRKFLKSDAAESAQVSRLVTQLALGHPETGFSLTSGGRSVLECPPARSFEERFFQLYGERTDLVSVRKEAGGLRLVGYVAALSEQGPSRGPQNVFVNRRIVKDRTIAHAIIEAYSVATVKERSPEVHLFLDIPPDRVDVNVHPTKAEVRFLEQSLVHEVLRRALAEALGRDRAPELQLRAVDVPANQPVPQSIPGVYAVGVGPSRWAPVTAAFVRPEHAGTGMQNGTTRADPSLPPPTAFGPETTERVRHMTPLGQFSDTFIVAIDEEGVAIIDQHVAHERVLFEQIMERLTAGRLDSQRLLHPMLLEIPAGEREALVIHRADLSRMGFEIEEFGGDSLRIVSAPAILKPDECMTAVRALADDLDGLDRGSAVEDVLRRIAATMACHAAVKAGDLLTREKMIYILDELKRTAYSTVCPHGRPVVLRITRREIERNFQRI